MTLSMTVLADKYIFLFIRKDTMLDVACMKEQVIT